MTTLKSIEDFSSLLELVEYFSSERVCIEYFQFQRWQGVPVCAHCDSDKVYKFSDGIRFKCKACCKQFTVKVGTIFESSKIPLKKWIMAMYLNANHKKGISSYQLARDLKITQKSSWYMLHRLRASFGVDNRLEDVDAVIEIDETFVGGKNKNRHASKKVLNSQGRSFKDKTPILGVMQRNGKVTTRVIGSTKGKEIRPIIRSIIKPGSVVITDEWSAYRGLNNQYQHFVVNHGIGQYAVGEIHTNNIESFWTWIKRMIVGTYHHTSRKHLQRYADEATFRFNTRNMTQCERFKYALSLTNVTLKYKDLIKKAA